MTAPLKAVDASADLPVLMTELAARARAAARVLALASADQKNQALEAMERAIRANAALILAANAEDVAEARGTGTTAAFIDRLALTQARVEAMADGIATVREIPDPVGVVTESWQRPNGMIIERVRVPLGVVAAHLATGLDQHRHQRLERRRGAGAIDQQRFGRAADAGAAHLGVEHDRFRHIEFGGAVDIDVVDAFQMRKHRHARFGFDAGDQALAAARHDHVDAAVQPA